MMIVGEETRDTAIQAEMAIQWTEKETAPRRLQFRVSISPTLSSSASLSTGVVSQPSSSYCIPLTLELPFYLLLSGARRRSGTFLLISICAFTYAAILFLFHHFGTSSFCRLCAPYAFLHLPRCCTALLLYWCARSLSLSKDDDGNLIIG